MLESLEHWIPRRFPCCFLEGQQLQRKIAAIFMLQAREQHDMAAMSDATIVSRAAAVKPARADNDRVIETSIPSRLDSLRWSGFHTRVVAALGITWIL